MGWSSNVLKIQIETNLYSRQISNNKVNNFTATLPAVEILGNVSYSLSAAFLSLSARSHRPPLNYGKFLFRESAYASVSVYAVKFVVKP